MAKKMGDSSWSEIHDYFILCFTLFSLVKTSKLNIFYKNDCWWCKNKLMQWKRSKNIVPKTSIL